MSSKHYAGKLQKEIVIALKDTAQAILSELINNHAIDKPEQYAYKRSASNLIDRNIITLSGDIITLTKKGKKLLKNIEREEITINTDKWDGIWRVIAYDIPEEYKKERNHFRAKLKELGFICLQKSMWVFPYECKEEISVFAHHLRISPYTLYLSTDNIPNKLRFKKIFNL